MVDHDIMAASSVPGRGGLIGLVRRLAARMLYPDMYARVAALEREAARLSRRLAPLPIGAPADVPPLEAHVSEVVKMLTLGVGAVYGTDVEGDIAEFGTMTGATAEGLARAIAAADAQLGYAPDIAGLPRKQLHLFDSFKGLPPAGNAVDANAPHVRTGAWAPGTCVGLTRDQLFTRVTAHLDPARVRIFDGWFSETLKTIPPGTKYALVHVDSDLYSSAKEVLDHLFANRMVAQGAEFFFDDWNCNRASPDFGERRAWRECAERFGIAFSDEGGYGLFSHKFVVHDYR